ncbi:MAG: hypothetical protein ACRDTA_26995 [Pseudonocardiaceae bacterium]
MLADPFSGLFGGVRGAVVEDLVDLLGRVDGLGQFGEELDERAESFRAMIFGWTVPVVTFMAAIRETVPWRTYSNSRRWACPARTGRVARLRERACMAVFSSTLHSTVSGGRCR